VMAPETTMNIVSLDKNFSRVMGQGGGPNAPFESSMPDAVDMVTIFRGKEWLGYVSILLDRHNVALTLSALLGVGLALLRKQRWGLILTVFIAIFLGILMAADRSQTQHYLLPIMPGLWLLSSAAVVAGLGHRPSLVMAGLTGVTILPLMAVVYQDYMWTRPDTRVVAKEWIEANIPSGAKILADGMRYRFVQSPPLNPDKSTVDHRVAQASEARHVSRGVSRQTLTLYAKAMSQVKGPTYWLHSTVWGLEVEALDYYILTCFDYIVTSSLNSERYVGEVYRRRFPKSAQFYEQLKTDPRFQAVYSIEPVSWKRNGPLITVYKVLPACGESSERPRSPSPTRVN
jgi:hypothetical protein